MLGLTFLASDQGAIAVSVCIALFGIWQLLLFRRELVPITSALSKALGVLKAQEETPFIQRLDTIADEFTDVPYFDTLWPEFHRQSIYIGNHNEVYCLIPPEAIFNSSTLIEPHIRLRWHSTVPNILTGLGLLGTFLGLAAGLKLAQGGLTSQNIGEMVAALRNLLGGASTAFLTSITGLAFSLFYNWHMKTLLRRAETQLDEFNAYLRAKMPVQSVERLVAQSHRQLVKQTDALQQFTTDLAISIGQLFDRTMIDNVVPKLDELITSVQILGTNQDRLNREQLTSIVNRFEEVLMGATAQRMSELEANLSALTSQLQEATSALATGDETIRRGLAQAAATLQESLTTAGAILKGQSADMHREIEQLIQSIAKQAEALRAQFSTGSNEFQTNVRAAADNFSSAIQHQLKAMDATLAKFQSASEEIGHTLNRGIHAFESLFAQIQESSRGLAQTVNQLRALPQEWQQFLVQTSRAAAQMSAVAQQLTGVANEHQRLSEQLRKTSAQLDGSAAALTKVWEEQRSRFEDLDRALADAFSRYQEGVEQFANTTKQYVADMDKHLSNATQQLSAAIAELGQLLEEWQEEASRVRYAQAPVDKSDNRLR